MSEPAREADSKPLGPDDDAEVSAVLAEFDGDHRAAIAALLHDLRTLALDAEASTSRGYVRGKVVRLRVRADAPQG